MLWNTWRKSFPILRSQAVQHPDHALHGVIRHLENEAVAGEALCQYHQGRFAAPLADYAVHFPMAEGFPVFDLFGPVLYRFALWKSGPVVIVLFGLVALPFIEQVFPGEVMFVPTGLC